MSDLVFLYLWRKGQLTAFGRGYLIWFYGLTGPTFVVRGH